MLDFLLRLNYSIHQHTGILCDSKFLIVGNFFNLAKINTTVPCMCSLSLFRTASRELGSSTYIESTTDAYSQYFVNDIFSFIMMKKTARIFKTKVKNESKRDLRN